MKVTSRRVSGLGGAGQLRLGGQNRMKPKSAKVIPYESAAIGFINVMECNLVDLLHRDT